MKYQAGGTLPRNTESYVMRQADYALRDKLLRGEYCYVLTPRQMGKSSLMVQTASALQAQGVASAIIDLSSQGYNSTPEQWYQELLDTLAGRLNLEDEMEAFCRLQAHRSPLQRWQAALRDIVLEHCGNPVVIFLDEIDITRRLAFSTDEFFAAIRACFNERTQTPAYNRLTFCLLGVASPPDLIRDPKMTPYNLGTRIDLHDFKREEAALLRFGLGHDDGTNQLLMERIYYWTQGHPYLTQKLCQMAADNEAILTSRSLDACCRKLFLDPVSGRKEPNLLFVSSRLAVEDMEKRAALLTLYARVLSGTPVSDNEANTDVSDLKLSGVVKSQGERLVIRNPIYQTVFDKRWVRDSMPDAEAGRQRRAYWKGVFRTLFVSSGIFTPVALFAIIAYSQWREAERATQKSKQATREAVQSAHDLRQSLYQSEIFNAHISWKDDDVTSASPLIEKHKPQNDPDKENWQQFEWRYLYGRLHQDRQTLYGHKSIVYCVACSPDGKWIASGSFDRTVRLWDASTGQLRHTLKGHTDWISALAFSPDSRLLATGSNDKHIRLWSVETGKEAQPPLTGSTQYINYLAFADNNTLISAGFGKRNTGIEMQGWDRNTGRVSLRLPFPNQFVGAEHPFLLLPDHKTLAVIYADKSNVSRIALLDVKSGRRIGEQAVQGPHSIEALQASPGGNLFAVWRNVSQRFIGSLNAKSRRITPMGTSAPCQALAVSTDGTLLAAGCWDNHILMWDTRTWKLISVLKGHADRVNGVAFTHDDSALVSVSSDATVKLWNLKTLPDSRSDEETKIPDEIRHHPRHFAFAPGANACFIQDYGVIHKWRLDTMQKQPLPAPISPQDILSAVSVDGKRFVTRRNNTLNLWEAETGRQVKRFSVPRSRKEAEVYKTVLSPNGQWLAALTREKGISSRLIVWDVYTQQVVLSAILATITDHLFFSDDGHLLGVTYRASKSHKNVTVWDMATRQEVYSLPDSQQDSVNGFQNDPMCAAFAPGNTFLAVGEWTGPLRIWEATTGRAIKSFRPHKQYVQSLCFSPDGKTLVTGGINMESRVKLWNVATWRELARFAVPDAEYLAFSSDGRHLFCMGQDGVHLWYAPSIEEIEARWHREIEAGNR